MSDGHLHGSAANRGRQWRAQRSCASPLHAGLGLCPGLRCAKALLREPTKPQEGGRDGDGDSHERRPEVLRCCYDPDLVRHVVVDEVGNGEGTGKYGKEEGENDEEQPGDGLSDRGHEVCGEAGENDRGRKRQESRDALVAEPKRVSRRAPRLCWSREIGPSDEDEGDDGASYAADKCGRQGGTCHFRGLTVGVSCEHSEAVRVCCTPG